MGTAQSARTRRHRFGATFTAFVGALALGTAITVGVLSVPKTHAPLITPASNQELAVVLSGLRLTPEPLTAAGLTAQQAATMVDNLREHLTTNMDFIRTAENELGTASNNVDALERRIRAGLSSEEERQQLASARQALSSAQSALNSLRSAAYTAATDGLDAETMLSLNTSRANLDGVAGDRGVGGIPTQYLVSDRSEPTWIALREALSNVRMSSRYGQEPNEAATSLLSSLNAEPATASAITRLNTNLAGVAAAYHQAIFGE